MRYSHSPSVLRWFCKGTHRFRNTALLLVGLPITTQAAQGSNILASYFSNIAQGYADYGFVYGFSTSVVGRGMSKPDDYSEETVDAIETLVNSSKEQTTVSKGSEPNIICVLHVCRNRSLTGQMRYSHCSGCRRRYGKHRI